jgi:tetratricopeptide (TPR) repeat protein
MAPIVEKREALSDYPRPADAPLSIVELSEANRSMVDRRRVLWSTYLRCDTHPEAAVATQFAPLLLDSVLKGSRDGLPVNPGSHYPAAFRQGLLGHAALPPDGIRLDLTAEDESRLPYLERLRAMLEPDSAVAVPTLLSLGQLLNVLGLYVVAARSLGSRAIASGDPLVILEVARSVYWVQPDSDKAIRPFHLLATNADNPLRVRLGASSRLVAHYCRRDKDLTMGAEVAEDARRLIDGAPTDTFAIRMGISRNYRALALYETRRRDAAAVAATMAATLELARDLSATARTPAERIAAAQNERLTLEASLKAFINTKGTRMVIDMEPEAAVDRLLELDPWDPYTQLYTGDTLWLLGQDERAVECFQTGGSLGTYPGALGAHRAGLVLRSLGRHEEAAEWFAVAAELDAAAPTMG